MSLINSDKTNLIVILGPTASGKTGFAAHLACQLDGEIISADSRQIYKRMDIGTGKDIKDYNIKGKTIPFHLIDIVEPGYKYNIYEYQKDFLSAFTDINSRNKTPMLCGGSGLYIESVTNEYKLVPVPQNMDLRQELEKHTLEELVESLKKLRPKYHNNTDFDTKKRAIRAIEIEKYYLSHREDKPDFPKIEPLILGVKYERSLQKQRITERLQSRLKEGMVEEVENLLKEGIKPEDLIYYGLEYKFVTQYLIGELDYGKMVEKLNIAIHQFSKRQMTWFRKMEKHGQKIFWIDGELALQEKLKTGMDFINKHYKNK